MTLERLDPRTHNKLETLDHYARYVFASQFVPGKRILDIACGFGYGAKLLRGAGACHVVAIDNSEEAITYAKTQYGDEQIDYYCADAHTAGSVVTGVFDVIVSFETIEHLARPDEFLSQCQQLAHRNTIFVLSVPNEAPLPQGFNPWHVHAFDAESFSRLLRKHFESVTLIPQYFSTASVIDAVPDSDGTALTLGHTCIARAQALPIQPSTYIAICGPVDQVPEPNCIVHGPGFFSDALQWTLELDHTRTWLDEQRQAWMHTAEERAAALAELERAKTLLDEQCQAWMHTAEERAAALAELERAKTWLDEQRQAWMHTAEERAAALAELERAKTLLDEQCQAWMHTAEERAAALAELERAKTWLDEQRQAWMHTAEERAAALADVKEELQQVLKTVEMTERWAEQLLRVRAWLIEQREPQEATITHQAAQLVEHEVTITHQAAQLVEHEATITHQAAQLVEHEATITHQAAQLAEHEATITHQAAQLAEHEATITHQAAQLAEHEVTITHQAAQLAEHEATITHQAAQLAEHEATITHQAAQLAEHEVTITHQAAQLAEHEVTITHQAAQLAQALADAVRCSEVLSAITNSRGYRLLGWSRTKLLPFETKRGRAARFLLRWVSQGLRPKNPYHSHRP